VRSKIGNCRTMNRYSFVDVDLRPCLRERTPRSEGVESKFSLQPGLLSPRPVYRTQRSPSAAISSTLVRLRAPS